MRIVLAFNGHPAACAAAKWLAETHAADVIALIVDVGQGEDPEELYGRALGCGAHRVHVVDRCEDFAVRAIVPAVASPVPLNAEGLRRLTYPMIAAALVEVAAIEDADAVAHASIDPAIDAEINALDPALRVLAPAREWRAQQVDVAGYVKIHRLSPGVGHPDRHLLIRRSSASASGSEARITVGFEAGVPRSVNGVAMELPELIESLSLIGGQYHVDDENGSPALVLLQQAYRESGGNGAATLKLQAPALVSEA